VYCTGSLFEAALALRLALGTRGTSAGIESTLLKIVLVPCSSSFRRSVITSVKFSWKNNTSNNFEQKIRQIFSFFYCKQ
jgi:hypothetical protein